MVRRRSVRVRRSARKRVSMWRDMWNTYDPTDDDDDNNDTEEGDGHDEAAGGEGE